MPIGVVVDGANTHDMKAAAETLDSIVVKRQRPRKYRRQNLCLDKGYDFPEIERESVKRMYVCRTSATEERRSRRDDTKEGGGS